MTSAAADREHVCLEHRGATAIVTFDNPPHYTIDRRTLLQTRTLISRLRDERIRSVILASRSPRYFVRHYCLEELVRTGRDDKASWDSLMTDVLAELEGLPKPVIAALSGTAMGGGFELSLAADIRIAKNGRYVLGLPEVSIGLVPGAAGMKRLAAIIGVRRAVQLVMRSKLLSPLQAFDLGIVDELISRDAPESALDRALALAERLNARPPEALASVKRLAAALDGGSHETFDREELVAFNALLSSRPTQELIQAAIAEMHDEEQ